MTELGTTPNPREGNGNPKNAPSAAPARISRREIRRRSSYVDDRALTVAGPRATAASRSSRTASAHSATSTVKKRKKSGLVNVAIMTLVVPGIFATIALPAYSSSPSASAEQASAAQLSQLKASHAQSVNVSTESSVTSTGRGNFTATSVAELASAKAAAKRAALAAAYAAYKGPSASDFLKNPPYPSFSLAQVVTVALQYRGVPYRYGGDNPSGFDCSGFTQFVYAQFGIALPHSASHQGSQGTKISRADAVPGDLIVLSDGSHVGFYMGPGMILDAPEAGGVVSVRPIWTDAYYIVREGI